MLCMDSNLKNVNYRGVADLFLFIYLFILAFLYTPVAKMSHLDNRSAQHYRSIFLFKDCLQHHIQCFHYFMK